MYMYYKHANVSEMVQISNKVDGKCFPKSLRQSVRDTNVDVKIILVKLQRISVYCNERKLKLRVISAGDNKARCAKCFERIIHKLVKP
jgi:hypothetical protein